MYKPRFKGTHYEVGFHYGSMMAKQGVDLTPQLKFTGEQFLMGKACLKVCEEIYPEITKEIKGMADGFGYDYEMFGTFIITAGAFDATVGCTTFAYRYGGENYFVRNHDMFDTLRKVTSASVFRLDNCYKFLGHSDGLIGIEDGINEHGLVVGVNFIAPKTIKPGLNFMLMVRMVLERCKTVQEALVLLKELPSITSHNIMLMDKSGDMAVYEMSAEHRAIRRPEDGANYMISVNHFQHEAMVEHDNRPEKNWHYTEDRLNTVENVLSKATVFTRELGMDIAKGKHGFTCQYKRGLGFDTLWSVSYQLSDLSILRAEGNPSRAKHKKDTRLAWAMK